MLGLKKDGLGRYTGAVAAIEGRVTAAIPAFLLLTGNWGQHTKSFATALAIFGVVVFAALYPQLGGAGQPTAAPPTEAGAVATLASRAA